MTQQSSGNPLNAVLLRVRQALRGSHREIRGAEAIRRRIREIASMVDLEEEPDVRLPNLEGITHLWELEENPPHQLEFVYIRPDKLEIETLSLDVEDEEGAGEDTNGQFITLASHSSDPIGLFLHKQQEARLIRQVSRKLGPEFRHQADPDADVLRQIDELAKRVMPEVGFSGPSQVSHFWFNTGIDGAYQRVWYIEPTQAPLSLDTDIRYIGHGIRTEGGQPTYSQTQQIMSLRQFLGLELQPQQPQPARPEELSWLRNSLRKLGGLIWRR